MAYRIQYRRGGQFLQLCCYIVTIMLVFVVPVVVSSMMDDWFKMMDSNKDGTIDKTEYEEGMAKLSSLFANSSTMGTDGLVVPVTSPGGSIFLPVDLSMTGFWKAFTSSLAMILATEVGDKTFFIAAVLSMKHARSAVFTGAILALIVMTILSTGMGLVLPAIMPKQYTHILGGILFLYFGIKLIKESLSMEDGKASDELEEVEEELLSQSNKKRSDEEEGIPRQQKTNSNNQKPNYQVALQAFSLTFLEEWGDRSQIATIALAAAKNPVGVAVGGFLGHATCTGLAVIGGRMLAARISEKTVSKWGGIIFLIFGLHSLFLES